MGDKERWGCTVAGRKRCHAHARTHATLVSSTCLVVEMHQSPLVRPGTPQMVLEVAISRHSVTRLTFADPSIVLRPSRSAAHPFPTPDLYLRQRSWQRATEPVRVADVFGTAARTLLL